MIKEVNDNIIQETEKDGSRVYSLDGKKYPSVTTICAYYPKGEGFYRWLSMVGWEKSQEVRDDAGIKGRNVHNRIEEFFKTEDMNFEDLTREEMDMLKNFIEWWFDLLRDHKVKLIANEITLINKEVGYAGTVDLIIEIDDVKWVIDFKTPKNIWPSHEIQLSAYKHCGYEDAKIGILQLSGDQHKFIEIEDKFELFLAVKKIFDYENKQV